ncbi:hypothetical protein PAMP_013734 [Pampus punctatissimus]
MLPLSGEVLTCMGIQHLCKALLVSYQMWKNTLFIFASIVQGAKIHFPLQNSQSHPQGSPVPIITVNSPIPTEGPGKRPGGCLLGYPLQLCCCLLALCFSTIS